MRSRSQHPHGFQSCSGTGLVAALPREGADRVGLALATLLGEREARGRPDGVLMLRVEGPAAVTAPGVRAALEWGARHGRRVVLRLATTVAPEVVEACREAGATVLLELAHPDPAVQAALLGAPGSSAAGLLLQSQHFASQGVPVGAVVGPLLPGLHDRPGELAPLWRHARAADVRDLHLALGPLTAPRLSALRYALGAGGLVGLARAFGVDPQGADGVSENVGGQTGPWRASIIASRSLLAQVEREAGAAGLNTGGCGCPAMCHLDRSPNERRPVPVLGPGLFASGY